MTSIERSSPIEEGTHHVDQHSNEDGACDGGPVLRLVGTANELLMVVLEGEAED